MQYIIELTEFQEKCLLNDLLDIQIWLQRAIDGKIDNSLCIAANREKELLILENATSMPISNNTLATNLFAREDYLNRAQRDAAAQQ